ncbi:MAG: prephenate dehydrogenase/arogenate dehydrogenase family protein [Candidatus Hydrogenedentota bacterium]|nr:MAG: prephenate dehydrogenase/arogenate dehydrogenase family protein [Candidatus Hydrogenedentota bacterium]
MQKIFIWGMGLLGTSLGLALRKKGIQVAGVVRSENSRKVLREKGFAEVYLSHEESIWQGILSSDGIVFGTPVDAIYPVLDMLLDRQLPDNIWITDMASTKAELMQRVENLNGKLLFIGSHPMAGSDLTGPENAREDLFENATVFMTLSTKIAEKTSPAQYHQCEKEITNMWELVGARTWQVSYAIHDKWAAYLSHGLHLVSCMVSHLLKDIPEVLQLPVNPAGGSFRDITRVAGSNPALWDTIISSNQQEVIEYLKSLESLTHKWRVSMEKDAFPIQDIFKEAADLRMQILKTEDTTENK